MENEEDVQLISLFSSLFHPVSTLCCLLTSFLNDVFLIYQITRKKMMCDLTSQLHKAL